MMWLKPRAGAWSLPRNRAVFISILPARCTAVWRPRCSTAAWGWRSSRPSRKAARTPKFENVSFYPSAAAAQEAGFRPCLRCRPEVSPELAFWRGTSNTVSRALALIESGGLDGDDVEGLANRLGVGARQLRRLFAQHVGASPVTGAQTRRVVVAHEPVPPTPAPHAAGGPAFGFTHRRPV